MQKPIGQVTVRPYKPCASPACGQITQAKYCTSCAEQVRERTRVWDRQRGSSTERGYDRTWRRAREIHLQYHPWCVDCERKGDKTLATVADHVIPHRGHTGLFWLPANWQSLCVRCHNRKTLNEDSTGYINDLYPIDLQPSRIPLTIVCGPSGSGKTTYVRKHAAEGDMVIDLDQIKAKLSGLPWYEGGDSWLDRSIKARNHILHHLAKATTGRAWYIVSAPRPAERAYWDLMLSPESVIVLAVPIEVCRRRLRQDKRRLRLADEYAGYAADWWSKYKPWMGDVTIDDQVDTGLR